MPSGTHAVVANTDHATSILGQDWRSHMSIYADNSFNFVWVNIGACGCTLIFEIVCLLTFMICGSAGLEVDSRAKPATRGSVGRYALHSCRLCCVVRWQCTVSPVSLSKLLHKIHNLLFKITVTYTDKYFCLKVSLCKITEQNRSFGAQTIVRWCQNTDWQFYVWILDEQRKNY